MAAGSESMQSSPDADAHVECIALWRLPDDFYTLGPEAQWVAIRSVSTPAQELSEPRTACSMKVLDEAMIAMYFLITLGLPWALGAISIVLVVTGFHPLKWFGFMVFLALHPMPRFNLALRSSRLALALIRYFSIELILDRKIPLLADLCTKAVDEAAFQDAHLPMVALACPHGVFNYGAIAWCCVSRWICGWYQYTGGAAAVGYVPGLRYLDPFVWLVDADRKSIKRALQERVPGNLQRGGMLGMVPDGILGAFRSTPGVDELAIGKKRGLMRICLEEGTTIYAGWFFGTTDMLTVVQDPWGIMEKFSRRFKAAIMFYYARFYLPIPYRVPVTIIVHPEKAEKTENPTEEQVEAFHQRVYGGLTRVYQQQRGYAGHPKRTLLIT